MRTRTGRTGLLLGLVLLEDLLHSAGDSGMARAGMVAYLLGAAVLLSAETHFLGTREWVYPQLVFYVIVAFLAIRLANKARGGKQPTGRLWTALEACWTPVNPRTKGSSGT